MAALSDCPIGLGQLVPDPLAVHLRLGQVLREARLLRRQLALSLRVRDELLRYRREVGQQQGEENR
ncbi:MAG: hypothetical protein U0840_29305 [Gemmataceae bacterium]